MIKKRGVHKKESAPQTQPTKEQSLPLNWIMVAIVAFLAVSLFIVRSLKGNTDEFKKKTIPDAVKKVVNDPNTKFEIASIKDMSGVYEFDLKLNNQTYTSYITKDGKILFTSGIKIADIGKPPANSQTQPQQKKLTCNDLQKTEQSKLTAFVVANCPYGLQIQRVFKKAIEEAPGLTSALDIKYIGSIVNGKITAMHGDEEAQENLRQICIREEQKDLYWPYVTCYMKEGKTDDCISSVGVNKTQLDACTTDPKRGNAFAQKDFDLANKFKVSGSPTLLLNDKQIVSEFDFGGRTPNSIKTLSCCGSKTQADYCSQEISTKDVAVSLSVTDEAQPAAAGSTGAAGCAPAK